MEKDYYSNIKPLLNKMKDLNLIDSLQVIRKDLLPLQIGLNNKKKNIMFYNAITIKPYFADFLIANLLKYSNTFTLHNSLKDLRIKKYYIEEITKINNIVNEQSIQENHISTWLKSYIFNQYKMQFAIHPFIILYRYYYLFQSDNIKKHIEEEIHIKLEHYWNSIICIFQKYCNSFYISKKAIYEESNNQPPFQIAKTISLFSISLNNLILCTKDYISKTNQPYTQHRIFNYYDETPHIQYPIFEYQDAYYCIAPIYLFNAAISGLYYRIINQNNNNLQTELGTNFENYIGLQLNYYLKNSQIQFMPEFTYNKGQNKSSDWILLDDSNLLFLECKLKRLTVNGKRNLQFDYQLIEQAIKKQWIKNRNSKKEYIDKLESSLTKDIIVLGIGIGKVYKTYNDYYTNKITGLPYNSNRKFHVCFLTLEETYTNEPHIKEQIIKVAQGYINLHSIQQEINIDDITIVSCSWFESHIPILTKVGLRNIFSTNESNYPKSHISNQCITELFYEKLANPIKQNKLSRNN